MPQSKSRWIFSGGMRLIIPPTFPPRFSTARSVCQKELIGLRRGILAGMAVWAAQLFVGGG
jgi:hypothetical protein